MWLVQAVRNRFEWFLPEQWLLIHVRGVFLCPKGSIDLGIDERKLQGMAALPVGVFDATLDNRVPPRLLRPPESLYELRGVDLGDCLDEVVLFELRPSGDPVVLCKCTQFFECSHLVYTCQATV